jgi:hypothetical protein
MAHLTVRWCTGHSTVHCPVSATADRWGLERLTVEVLCPLAALDSPVCSDFAALTTELCTVHSNRPLDAVDRCSVGSPDSPVNYSGATPRKTESDQFVGALAWAPDSVWCATDSTNACLCYKLVELSNLFSLFVCIEIYAPVINEN